MERFEKIGLFDPRVVEGISGGVHLCYLGDPIHLVSASQGLCDLVGYSPEDMDGLFHGDYSRLIHPDDVDRFEEFVCELADHEGTQTIFYRLVTREGDVVPVVDTMTSRILDDGVMWGYSIVNDLSGFTPRELAGVMGSKGPLPVEDHERAPLHGMVRILCTERPRVLSVDDGMLFILGVTKDEIIRDRAQTIERLESLYSDLIAKVARMRGNQEDGSGLKRRVIRRVDGSLVRIANWISWKGSPDEKVCQLFVVLEDADVGSDKKIERDMENFEKFSHEAADVVFNLSLVKDSITCLKNSVSEFSSIPTGLPLVASEVFDMWFSSHLDEDERKAAWEMVAPEGIPFEGIIEHRLFHVRVGQWVEPASVLLLSEGSRALLLLKFLQYDARGGGLSRRNPQRAYASGPSARSTCLWTGNPWCSGARRQRSTWRFSWTEGARL